MSTYRKLKKKLGLVLSFVIVFSTAFAGFSWTVFAASGVAPACRTSKLSSIVISGTAQVGKQLTATLTPRDATATYQWQISTTARGPYSAISLATGSTYTPVAGQENMYIEVVATGTGLSLIHI